MEAPFDLVIRNGEIVDGTGAAPFRGDVAIRDERIVAVGAFAGAGAEEIDATGHIVTPGFVDVHTHYDGQVTWETRMSPSSSHGVTTVVMGNCGVGFAPSRPEDRELVIKLMEGVEDIPEVVMAAGLPWNWTSFPDYLDALEARRADIDFAAQLPHSPLRVFVMGQRGVDLEAPTEADLTEMTRLTAEALRAGALGVTTSRNLFHRFRDGHLAPSVTTAEDELLALARGLREAGTGVFQCIPRLENTAAEEMELLRAVARVSGRPVNFSFVPMPHRPQNPALYLQELDRAAAEGLRIRGHFLPRPVGVLFGLTLSYHPFTLHPTYKAIADLPLDERVARMRDPEVKARILAERPEDPNPLFIQVVNLRGNLYRVADPVDYHFTPEDRLRVQAERLGISEDEMIYDALLEADGHAIIGQFATETGPHVEASSHWLQRPDMVVGLGDGGAHYGMICDAAYPSYLLSQRIGMHGLTLPRAIQALTSSSAASVGLDDRGVIAPGYKADINVIDLANLRVRRPSVRADLPSGGKRLRQEAEGYLATVVSGVVTYRAGEHTGALPGKLVRGQKAAPETARALAPAA